MSRKLVGPGIIQQRIDARASNNMWNYVAKINPQLRDNRIYADDSIHVDLTWVVSPNMINQLIELYQSIGWVVSVTNLSEETQFVFTAP